MPGRVLGPDDGQTVVLLDLGDHLRARREGRCAATERRVHAGLVEVGDEDGLHLDHREPGEEWVHQRREEVDPRDDHVGVGVGELVGAGLGLVLVDGVVADDQLDRSSRRPGLDVGPDPAQALVDHLDGCLGALADLGERSRRITLEVDDTDHERLEAVVGGQRLVGGGLQRGPQLLGASSALALVATCRSTARLGRRPVRSRRVSVSRFRLLLSSGGLRTSGGLRPGGRLGFASRSRLGPLGRPTVVVVAARGDQQYGAHQNAHQRCLFDVYPCPCPPI